MTAAASHTDLTRLPPTLDLVDAARLLGIGRTLAYEMVREETWPTPVIRAGRRIRIPSRPLLDLLGLTPTGIVD
jgi:hypothetical protein